RCAADLLTAPFPGQRLFDALLFSKFQLEGVILDFLDDVFLLNIPLETPQCILDGFTVLNANFGHYTHPQSRSKIDHELFLRPMPKSNPVLYSAVYGTVSLVFGAPRQAVLSRQGGVDLRGLLRQQTGSGNRLPFILPAPA